MTQVNEKLEKQHLAEKQQLIDSLEKQVAELSELTEKQQQLEIGQPEICKFEF